MEEKLTVMERDEETCHFKGSSQDSSESDYIIVDQPSVVKPALIDQCSVEEEDCKMGHGVTETLLGSNYVDLESSWTVGATSGPWWRTDAQELAFFVTERSLILVENCDLPSPQNSHTKKGLSIHQSLVKPRIVSSSNDSVSGNIAGRSSSEFQLRSRHGVALKMDKSEEDTAHLLEALRHSQTRARESEEAAKQSCAEKEHIVKLLLRQASHLFAYKQWFRLLQLENSTYLHAQSNKSQQEFPPSPTTSPPYTPSRRKKMSKNTRTSHNDGYDIGKYAVVFAVGLGLIGAGMILGWGMALFLPPW